MSEVKNTKPSFIFRRYKFISEEIKNTLDLETMREDIEVEVGVLLNENTTMGYRGLNDLLSSVINNHKTV